MRASIETSTSSSLLDDFTNEKQAVIVTDELDIVLPPTDGGREAWLFMVGSVIVDAVIWGFPLNFGIFQNYLTQNGNFNHSQYIPMIGTFATGIAYLGGPLMTPLTLHFHQYRRQMVCLGVGLCVLGTGAASVATELWQLILCQGILYGTGFLVISYVVFSQLNEWFVERRGLAYGIQLSASGIGGLILPFLLQTLLDNYGYATTLRIYILIIIGLVGPAILLLRSRPRIIEEKPLKARIDYAVLRKPIFYILAIANLLQGLAFYIPIFYLPSFATSLGLSEQQASLLLALLNLAHIFGMLTMGYLSDHLNVFILLFSSTFFSALTTLFSLGPSKSFSPLCFFAIFYGFLGGGFESLFPRFVTALTKDEAAELLFYGVFEFERGLGIVLAGPVSGLLVGEIVDVEIFGLGMYSGVVLFVGITLGIASVAGVGWFWGVEEGEVKKKSDYGLLNGEEDCN